MSVLEKILEEIEKVASEHPYKVPGKPETYNSYNEAWEDCADRIMGIITGMMKDEKGNDENGGWISIDDERFWRILSEEACVEGQQAERIHQRLKEICGDGWIPVEEGLPEVSEDIDDDDCPEFNVTIDGSDKATTLKYSSDGVFFDDNGYVYSVIAWQPLPAPYRPKEEDDV